MSLSFPTSPTTGQIYQNWKWSGSSWDPVFGNQFVTSYNGRTGAVVPVTTDATTGNRVLLATFTVTTALAYVTAFQNSFDGTYDHYEVEVQEWGMTTTGNDTPGFQVTTDGGTTWQTTAIYNTSINGGAQTNTTYGFVTQIAGRFGVVVSQKVAAQALPLVGALGGAAVNYAFIDHFQDVARGHFAIRRMERTYGKEIVHAEYERVRAELKAAV